MNFDEYKNQLPYPRSNDFVTTYFYADGKLVGQIKGRVASGNRPADAKSTEESFDANAFKLATAAYYAETNKLMAKFFHDCKKDLGIDHHPNADLLMDIAWERAHDGGFQNVYNEALDLARLLA